jgi:sorting nexin-13
LNSPKALNGNLSSTRQSVSGYQNDNLQKDKDFAAVDGLRLRKGSTDQNLETSVSNASADMYQDHSGSDPEQNDYSFSINSGDHKKMLASQTDYASQILESDGYSVTPNEVRSDCFYNSYYQFIMSAQSIFRVFATIFSL